MAEVFSFKKIKTKHIAVDTSSLTVLCVKSRMLQRIDQTVLEDGRKVRRCSYCNAKLIGQQQW